MKFAKSLKIYLPKKRNAPIILVASGSRQVVRRQPSKLIFRGFESHLPLLVSVSASGIRRQVAWRATLKHLTLNKGARGAAVSAGDS